MASSHQREKLFGVIVASIFVLWAWPAEGEERLAFLAVATEQPYRDAGEAFWPPASYRAASTTAPVVVDVEVASGSSAPTAEHLLAAARQSIRLSSTELVLKDNPLAKVDVRWTLKPLHSGAILLTASYVDWKITQEFPVSFVDVADLTKRIGDLIQSRMHRIRYVWLYEEATPVSSRNVDFGIRDDSSAKVRGIAWLNPERNAFGRDIPFEAMVVKSGVHDVDRDGARFSRTTDQQAFAFAPMGNTAYPALLIRPSKERGIFRVLTVMLVALLAAAAAGAVVAGRTAPAPEAPRLALAA